MTAGRTKPKARRRMCKNGRLFEFGELETVVDEAFNVLTEFMIWFSNSVGPCFRVEPTIRLTHKVQNGVQLLAV